MTKDDMMTRGREGGEGVWIPPESVDVIYEQPHIVLSSGKALHNTSNCLKSEGEEYDDDGPAVSSSAQQVGFFNT